MREISIENSIEQSLSIDETVLTQVIATLDAHFTQAPVGELSIVFVDVETLAQMHADYCDDPTPTDIITFPFDEEEMWGELYISPMAAKLYVAEHGGNFSTELTRYVIHGYLHLLGYDDIEPDDYDKMKELEGICLQKIEAPQSIFTWAD